MSAMQQNDRWRWLTAGAVAVCLLAFTLLIGLLGWQGVRAFWPQPVDQYWFQPPTGDAVMVLGETLQKQQQGDLWRYVVKTGNRDFAAPDFRVLYSQGAAKTRRPADVLVLQRRSGGNAYGWLVALREDNEVLTASNREALLHQRLMQVPATARRRAAAQRHL